MDTSSTSGRHQRAAWLLTSVALAAFALAAFFGVVRHMHVDEVGSLYCMRLVERFGLGSYATPAELYIVLLAPLARLCDSTHALWLTLRIFYALLLLGLCVGLARTQRSLKGALGVSAALLLTVTYAPLFRHGFEVRHDQFFALGWLALYGLAERARERGIGAMHFGLAGAMLALIQACSFKAIVTLAPALLLALWLASRAGAGSRPPWLRLAAATAAGFAGGAVVAVALLHTVDALGAYLEAQRFFKLASTAPPYRLKQWPVLELMLEQGPLQAALAALGAAAILARPRQLLSSSGFLPLCLALIAWLSALPNPTLFPYNLIWLSLPLLLLSFEGLRVVVDVAAGVTSQGLRIAMAATAVLLALASWAASSFDQFRLRTFHGQLEVVAAAEALTLPSEPVLDMTGLVASRPPPGKDWMVHSLLASDVREGRRESIQKLIERVAPPVVVSGQYRVGLVEREDRAMIDRSYVPVTRELGVLGGWFDERREVHILRAGQYEIDAGFGESAAGSSCKLDGQVLAGGARLWLTRGRHEAERLTGACRLRWVGPPGSPPPASASDSPLFERPTLLGQR